MTHLSTNASVCAMIFYSLVTFFLTPYLTSPFIPGGGPEKCVAGFTLGFAISIMLWFMYKDQLTHNTMSNSLSDFMMDSSCSLS